MFIDGSSGERIRGWKGKILKLFGEIILRKNKI